MTLFFKFFSKQAGSKTPRTKFFYGNKIMKTITYINIRYLNNNI